MSKNQGGSVITGQSIVQELLDAARELSNASNDFANSKSLRGVSAVYNPLDYAWDAYAEYITRFCDGTRRVVFLGMNPGPYGMTQTGVPFGEVGVVRDWLKIQARTGRPEHEHPAYPVMGLSCPRSEVSGRRLWGLFASRFGEPGNFFVEHCVMNYCPLVFIADSPRKSPNAKPGGKNLTPDKLNAPERRELYAICNRHLHRVLNALRPEYLVGIGSFAEDRASELLTPDPELAIKIVRILHPSPASPLSNRDWPGTVTRQLIESGVWRD